MIILRFYYAQGMTSNGQKSAALWSTAEIMGDQTGHEIDYAKYLGGVFHFDINSLDHCADVFLEIKKLERGEIEKTGWIGNAFATEIYTDRVEIEHQQFAGHPDWPLWTCTLAEFRAALEGWMRFLKMPVDINSEIIVEIQ